MKITNLRYYPQHLQILAGWHQNQWGYLNPGETLTMRIERMQSYLNPDAIPSMWIAIENDELLGSAAIDACDMDTRPNLTPWLASVFVKPEHRRRGVAQRLVERVIAEAAALKQQHLYLFTPDQENYYRDLGAELISREEYHCEQVSVMRFILQEV